MEQYIVRLVQRPDNDPLSLIGSVEMIGSGLKKYFTTVHELHAILTTLEENREHCNVIWVREHDPVQADSREIR